jgi:hypothetical protein
MSSFKTKSDLAVFRAFISAIIKMKARWLLSNILTRRCLRCSGARLRFSPT